MKRETLQRRRDHASRVTKNLEVGQSFEEATKQKERRAKINGKNSRDRGREKDSDSEIQ